MSFNTPTQNAETSKLFWTRYFSPPKRFNTARESLRFRETELRVTRALYCSENVVKNNHAKSKIGARISSTRCSTRTREMKTGRRKQKFAYTTQNNSEEIAFRENTARCDGGVGVYELWLQQQRARFE